MTGEFKTHFRAIEKVEPIKTCRASEGEKHIFFGAAKRAKYNDLTFPPHPFSLYILILRLMRIEGMPRTVIGGKASGNGAREGEKPKIFISSEQQKEQNRMTLPLPTPFQPLYFVRSEG